MVPKTRACALLLGLFLLPAIGAQAAKPGWYLVGLAGESSASGLSQDRTDQNLIEIFESGGQQVVDSTSTLDDSDTGFGFAGGYQLNDHFAIEFAYVDLGAVEYQISATVSDGVDEFDADVRLGSSAQGPIVSFLGILPVGERLSLFGRAGLSLLNADGTVRIALDGTPQRASQSSQKSDLVLGAGAELSLGRHFAIRLAWERYFDVGTEDVTGDIDADFISLGLRMGLDWFR